MGVELTPVQPETPTKGPLFDSRTGNTHLQNVFTSARVIGSEHPNFLKDAMINGFGGRQAALISSKIRALERLGWRLRMLCAAFVLLCLPACTTLAPGHLPETVFDTPDSDIVGLKPIRPTPSVPIKRKPGRILEATSSEPQAPVNVWLYASLASQAHLMKLGADPTTGTRLWENYLRASNIPFARISTAEKIAQIPAFGVLILASTVVLSDAEKKAVMHWRDRGGSILSTWMTATHSEIGESLGFGFMADVLDVKVVGTTKDAIDDTFMVVHGDNPVAHSLPAGTRVWLERVPHQLPLRLVGKQDAAQIMDWSRGSDKEKPSGLVTFNERKMPSGLLSRTVTLGYPEQNWQRSDPKQLGAISGNILSWLLRQPQAYVGAWPFPYQGGFLLALQAAEAVTEVEMDIARTMAALGGRATFYINGGSLLKTTPAVKKIQSIGHEIAYFGDQFEGFKDQKEAVQVERLGIMRKQFSDAGIVISRPPSFSAPMDSYDKTTQRLLEDGQFDNYLAFTEVTESRLPVVATRTPEGLAQTVILPRTLIGPEESTDVDDPVAGLNNFLLSLELSVRMGGLSVVRLPSQSLLLPVQRKLIFDKIASLRERIWMASANQIAQWWRHREHVSVTLEPHLEGYLLTATVARPVTILEPLSIWINHPHLNSRVRLLPQKMGDKLPVVQTMDPWRSVIALRAPTAGKHQWLLHFDEPLPAKKL